MNKELIKEVSKVVDVIKEYDSQNRIVFMALWMSHKAIHKFVKEFNKMDSEDITEKILDLASSIIIFSKTIYENDRYNDVFDDETYDNLLSKFKKFRPEPFGKNVVGLANAEYKYDNLSGTLDKVHHIYSVNKNDDRGSLEEYVNSIPVSKHSEFSVLVNEKKDGTSVTIDYELREVDGHKRYVPSSAISRGSRDYGRGTDVSAVLPNTDFDSHKIKEVLGFLPKSIGIQYELLVSDKSKKRFEEYCKQSFANNRSAATGLLRRLIFAPKKEQDILKKYMSLVPVGFDILDKHVEDKNYYSIPWNDIYIAILDTFNYGDIVMKYKVLNGDKKSILEQFSKLSDKWYTKRSELNHAIDGMVMTILDRDIQTELGRKNSINKYQIAYKFPEEGHKTTIRGIEITSGNFGYKEMLLLVDPVILNGTKQGKAQVHSLNRFNELEPRIGDEIILKLSGDVIPYGYKDSTCRKGTGEKLKFPTHCECCGERLVEQNSKYRCSNINCKTRVIGSLVTFFSELNAKGIGPSTCEQLYTELGIRKPSEILTLKKKDFLKLNGFKDKSAELCIKTIQEILDNPRRPETIISSLSIDSLRASTAKKLLNEITLDELMKLLEHQNKYALEMRVRKSEGIDKTASGITDGLIDNYDELVKLLELIPIEKTVKKSFDKKILVSGLRNDKELTKVANDAGFEVIESGTKYDILVIKDTSMMGKSKALYALSHSKPIFTRNEFIERYGSGL